MNVNEALAVLKKVLVIININITVVIIIIYWQKVGRFHQKWYFDVLSGTLMILKYLH